MPDTPRQSRPARSLAAMAGLVLYGLLVDAAVETYQSGSSIRLWVAVPVALYVAFTLWLLQQHRSSRPGPVASIWLSSFLFLALLSITATMPDGLRQGMRAVTLSTSTLLSVTTIGVIALALASLTVGSPLPIAGRIVAALAGCYGLAAFGSGIVWQRSYLQLLQGGSFWERLPYWLQGAFVGALVVVPLAFVLEVGVALARLKVRGRMHRIVAFALGFVMAYAAFTATPTSTKPTPAPGAQAVEEQPSGTHR